MINQLTIDEKRYRYFDITRYTKESLDKIPYSLRVLLENLMRHQKRLEIPDTTLQSLFDSAIERPSEIPFHPTRVLMQDFTGVPGIVDLASLRDAMVAANSDPKKINPHVP